MIPYKIFPMLSFGPIHFNMFGVMFALGFAVATFLAVREAKKRNIEKEIIYDLVFDILIGAIIGARLFYVAFYWPEDISLTFFDIFKIWQGGLAWFGGFLGALVSGFFYTRKHKLNFWLYADILTIPLVVGHIFGRFGGYFTGLHPGKIADLPWSIYLDGALRHPVILYEILGLVIIIVLLKNIKNFFRFNGFIFSSYVILYSIQRMFLDFFRIETTDPKYFELTPSQYLVTVLFALALLFIVYNSKNKYKKERR